jgi:hypothetical protein
MILNAYLYIGVVKVEEIDELWLWQKLLILVFDSAIKLSD